MVHNLQRRRRHDACSARHPGCQCRRRHLLHQTVTDHHPPHAAIQSPALHAPSQTFTLPASILHPTPPSHAPPPLACRPPTSRLFLLCDLRLAHEFAPNPFGLFYTERLQSMHGLNWFLCSDRQDLSIQQPLQTLTRPNTILIAKYKWLTEDSTWHWFGGRPCCNDSTRTLFHVATIWRVLWWTRGIK